jgi:Kef-type K+ transport system membrane component KefB
VDSNVWLVASVWMALAIGAVGFLAPFLGAAAFAHWGGGWLRSGARIAGIARSTTSVAVVYAVMLETGLNRTEIGKLILAACCIADLGTVLALGVLFANLRSRGSRSHTPGAAPAGTTR